MPTGYTDCLKDENITLKQFVLKCTRAFGVCADMRDSPMNTPIPNQFTVDSYFEDRVKDAQHRVDQFLLMTNVALAADMELENIERKLYINKSLTEKQKLLRNYQNMLTKVKAWNPSNPDFVNIKNFMIEQIEGSIDFDCNTEYEQRELKQMEDTKMSIEKYRDKKYQTLTNDLKYAQKSLQDEQSIVDKRNKFMSELRKEINNL